MQIDSLKPQFDKLQSLYGEPTLDSIYGAGCVENPKICFIFMNPTGRNTAANKSWKGLKAPWIGTKNVWKLFSNAGLFPISLANEIYKMKADDWTEDFANDVYQEISRNGLYITNLAKCTQTDAKPLNNSIFKKYLELMYEEISMIRPQKIITFGNQVSSIFLRKPVFVSKSRKQIVEIRIGGQNYKTLPVFYPVGQGMRNLPLAIEDIKWFNQTKF